MLYKLLNGVILPEAGVGTAALTDKLSTADAEDLLAGFLSRRADTLSLIDTAPSYGTEELIGKAVSRALKNGVPRENIILQTKISNEKQGYEAALAEFGESLEKLGVNFVDVLLIHWPVPRYHENDFPELNLSTWRAMEKLYREGKVRAIGVSNFLPAHLKNISRNSEVPLMVNQLEIHPWYQQRTTVDYCQQNNILVEAWGPFRLGKIFASDEMKNLAEKYHVAPEKISLAWLRMRGILPIAKSSSMERMLGNLEIPQINFSQEDLATLAALDDPNGHYDFWNYKRQLNSCNGGTDMDNLFDINGKVILITGASSGIGESAADLLSSRQIGGGRNGGIILCARREDRLQRLAENLHEKYGVEVLPIKCDVSIESDVENAVKAAVEKFGRIDILLNCAGITAKSSDITDHSLEQWNKVLDTNLTGTYLFCREVAKIMKAQNYGKVINVTSMVALLGCGNQIGYSASKGGVISFTRSLSVELGKYNITVNAIAPGYVMTEMTNIKSRGYAYFKSRSVLNTVGEPEDMHGAILLLASDASRYLTGAIIPVDGGITANL